MAAIDYFGTVVRVTAAGTANALGKLMVTSTVIWSADSTASLIAVLSSTGGSEVLRFSTNVAASTLTGVPFRGTFENLSFNTVTACTAYLYLI